MYKTKEQLKTVTRLNYEGKERMFLTNLADFDAKNEKIKTFAYAQLKPGEQVGFHVHEGESEMYYIISGKGIYTDNDKDVEISAGAVTHTVSGEGHALKNTGDEMLEFIALILLD